MSNTYPAREDLATIGRADLQALPDGFLVVYISTEDLPGQPGIRPGSTPVEEISQARLGDDLERTLRWWQYKAICDQLELRPLSILGAVLAVTGGPDDRWIWTSIRLDRQSWSKVVPAVAGLLDLMPLVSGPVKSETLNWRGLRGRRLADREFGPVKKGGLRQFGWNSREGSLDVIAPSRSGHL